jgi:hypothetical protein
MLDLKCVGCGCTIPPDSMKCPNCGHQHAEVRAKPKSNGNGITVGRIGYAIKCETHGRIQITATTASQSVRCPFC